MMTLALHASAGEQFRIYMQVGFTYVEACYSPRDCFVAGGLDTSETNTRSTRPAAPRNTCTICQANRASAGVTFVNDDPRAA